MADVNGGETLALLVQGGQRLAQKGNHISVTVQGFHADLPRPS